MRNMCKKEDDKDVDCVKNSILEWFDKDICMGNSCKLTENAVTTVILGIVIYFVDAMLGCALSFVAQPSFWIGITGGTDEIGNAGNILGEAEGVHRAGKDGKAEAAKRTGKTMWVKQGSATQTAWKAHAVAAEQGATNIMAKRGMSAGSIGKIKKSFKNWLPCLPLALLAWLDGSTSFFACMGKCMAEAVGASLASLLFRLVKNCLWKMIKDALENSPLKFLACFPADASVQLSSGQSITMEQLQVGDSVLTQDGTFSEVYVMSHANPDVVGEFVSIKLANQQRLDATAKHFVFVSPKCDGSVQQVYASSVKEGMCMFTRYGETGEQLQPVEEVSVSEKRGIYNPFTLSGSIVVNGVVASSHSDWFLDEIAEKYGWTTMLPDIYQAVLMPARGLYHLMGAEVARRELKSYQAELETATEAGWVVKPYWDLFVRSFMLLTGLQS